MALADTKLTILQIVNEVQRKLSLRATSATTDTAHAKVLVDLLNDVIEDCADTGDWMQLRGSQVVSAVSGQAEYEIPVSGTTESIHHLEEIRVSGRSPALDPFFDITNYRQLNSLSSRGRPNQYAVVSEDSRGNPKFGVWPAPGANEDGLRMTVHFYFKPRRYVAGTDDAEILQLPGRLLVQGLLAKAILDENGGAPTPQFQVELAMYEKMKKQALARFTSDTGGTLRIQPGR